MKKYKVYVIIATLILLIPIIMKSLEKKYTINYHIKKWNITESFQINQNTYDIIIKKGNDEYSYSIHYNFYKRKRIINQIVEYKEDTIHCIIPIYRKSIDSEIYCVEDHQQVSNEALKSNENFQTILEKAKKYKIKNIPSNNSKYITYENVSVYQNNIPKGSTIILWNYKGIYLFDHTKTMNQKMLTKDLYDNVMTTTTSKYYVLFENTEVKGIENIYYYDIVKEKTKVFHPDILISKDSYINGTCKDLIYVTDNKTKKQYTIDLKREMIKEIGNEEIGYIKYIDGQETELGKRQFFEKKQFFSNDKIQNKKISENEIIQEGNYYYFMENNQMYKQMKNSTKKRLFEIDDIKEWKIVGEDILLLQDDTLYLYNDKVGLRTILQYNELRYNYENIYTIWKE